MLFCEFTALKDTIMQVHLLWPKVKENYIYLITQFQFHINQVPVAAGMEKIADSPATITIRNHKTNAYQLFTNQSTNTSKTHIESEL